MPDTIIVDQKPTPSIQNNLLTFHKITTGGDSVYNSPFRQSLQKNQELEQIDEDLQKQTFTSTGSNQTTKKQSKLNLKDV